MANVTWLNGKINPPESGGYYVILEAQRDMEDPNTGKILHHVGDIDLDEGWFDRKTGCWQSLGKDNPFWRVLSWANILRPTIPKDIRHRVKRYFGVEVNCNG